MESSPAEVPFCWRRTTFTEIMSIAKPQMRGLLNSSIKKNLIISGVLCVISVFAMKFGFNDVRKAKYAEFYKTYDAEKDFERMRKTGVLQSVKP
ncbi:hypothetical protein B566_EDAN008138 [Ephemera danica]|nr:hypothetical protein B566_EDAN008138 [Ephemera danica]